MRSYGGEGNSRHNEGFECTGIDENETSHWFNIKSGVLKAGLCDVRILILTGHSLQGHKEDKSIQEQRDTMKRHGGTVRP